MRLIDADALKRNYGQFNHNAGGKRYCDQDIDACPTVDAVPVVRMENITEADGGPLALLDDISEKMNNIVEVVRCKDCRHRDPEDHKCDCGETERQWCPFPVDDDYFCKYGERKGGDE